MKSIYLTIITAVLLLSTSCEKLNQDPPIQIDAQGLEDYDGVLNAAYYYQLGMATPMAVMGDFRADNAYMFEAPFTNFDEFTSDLPSMEGQFFRPFYTAAYNSILSANNVIENSEDATQVGEARFLRGLAYFKLVQVFGDVTVILTPTPDLSDLTIFERQPRESVYNNVIIPDLQAAISALDANITDGRASKYAAQSILGKVYMHRGEFSNAEAQLAAVVNGASAAGIMLEPNFNEIFGFANEDGNTEIIYATQVNSSIEDEYGFSEFWSWSGGLDTKSLTPLDPAGGATIIAAFDNSPGDLRRATTVNDVTFASPKFPQTDGPDHDWIEVRLADVILLHAEAMNENGSSAEDVLDLLDDIRTRAGLAVLDHTVLNTQELVREAIQTERRLELAFEGHRWFDLVRTGTVDAAMGETVNSNYHIFPIPLTEIDASFNNITQNPGY